MCTIVHCDRYIPHNYTHILVSQCCIANLLRRQYTRTQSIQYINSIVGITKAQIYSMNFIDVIHQGSSSSSSFWLCLRLPCTVRLLHTNLVFSALRPYPTSFNICPSLSVCLCPSLYLSHTLTLTTEHTHIWYILFRNVRTYRASISSVIMSYDIYYVRTYTSFAYLYFMKEYEISFGPLVVCDGSGWKPMFTYTCMPHTHTNTVDCRISPSYV